MHLMIRLLSPSVRPARVAHQTVRLASTNLVGLSKHAAPAATDRFLSTEAPFAAAKDSPNDSTPAVTLYQYAICPFCHKVKALLAYAGLPHDVVEVNPLTKAELKPWSGDYKKVPIAKVDGSVVTGSDGIIKALLDHPRVSTALEDRWSTDDSSSGGMTLDEFRSSESATKWAKFANDDLAALLYPNICRTLGDSYQAFGYVEDVAAFSPFQKVTIRYAGAMAMYLAASRVKSKRGITDERQALHDALSTWESDGLGGGSKFASGRDVPNLGDLALFGVLRSVEGFPAHADAIQIRGGPVKDWYDRMHLEVLKKGAEH